MPVKRKKPKKKRNVGRPTKYKGVKTIETVEAIAEEMAIETFFSWCGVEHIANFLGVHRDTIYEWRGKHPQFDEAIKKWENKRNALFYTLALRLNPSVWIFLAKNWLGLKDRFDFEGTTSSEVFQYISHIPPPKKKKKSEEEEDIRDYPEVEE